MGRVIGASAGISTFPADAVAGDIRKGKKAVVDNVMLTGTMEEVYVDNLSNVGTTSTTYEPNPVFNMTVLSAGTYTAKAVIEVEGSYSGNVCLYKNDVFLEGTEKTRAPGAPFTEVSWSGLVLAAGDKINVVYKVLGANTTIWRGTRTLIRTA